MSLNLENVDGLLRETLGKTGKIQECNITSLLGPGENYAGKMLRVDVKLVDSEGKSQEIHAVAKTPNFDVADFFKSHIPFQYKKEIGFYGVTVPALKKFYAVETGEDMDDIYPVMLAGRFNLKGTEEPVDEDACIFMENLVSKGFQNIDRHVGFGLDAAKVILRDVATFHAVPIAFKLKKPQLFDVKVKKYAAMEPDHNPPIQKSSGTPLDEKRPPHPMLKILSEFDGVVEYMDKLAPKMSMGRRAKPPPNEPWGTVGHNDLWTNNTMQIIEDGKVLKNKLIDFQQLCYQSPIKDLLFFLSTSLEVRVFEDHFDDLILFYHQEFLKVIRKLKCDVSLFDEGKFREELEQVAPQELHHILALMTPVHGDKGVAVIDTKKGPMFDPEKVSLRAKQRSAGVIRKFGKKGWI